MTIFEPEVTREGGMEVFNALRAQAGGKYPDGLGIEEFDEEIRKVRYGEEQYMIFKTVVLTVETVVRQFFNIYSAWLLSKK